MRLFLILALLLAVVVAIFAVQNNTPITVSFLVWTLDGSMALVLIITLAFGFLIGLLVSTPSAIRNRFRVNELTKKIKILENDLLESRVPPPRELGGQPAGDQQAPSEVQEGQEKQR
jgi:uncharacterized integral membrane protein